MTADKERMVESYQRWKLISDTLHAALRRLNKVDTLDSAHFAVNGAIAAGDLAGCLERLDEMVSDLKEAYLSEEPAEQAPAEKLALPTRFPFPTEGSDK